MKVIMTSNYNLDCYAEKQCSFVGLTSKQAHDECEVLNKELPIDGPDWHRVVTDAYVLDNGDPNS